MRAFMHHAIAQASILALASAVLSQPVQAKFVVAQPAPREAEAGLVVSQPPLLPLARRPYERDGNLPPTFPNAAPPLDPLVARYQAQAERPAVHLPDESPQSASGPQSVEEEARASFEAERASLLPDRLRVSGVSKRREQLDSMQPDQAQSYYTYAEGVVTAAETGLPVNYVYVAAYDRNGHPEDYDWTDKQGKYQLLVSPGSHMLRFDPALVYPYYFAPEWYDNQVLSNTATLITTTSNANLPRTVITANAVLDRGAQITGAVLALDTGLPVTNTRIIIYDANGSVVNRLEVAADGQYRTSGLGTGAYRLCALVDTAYGESTRYLNGCDKVSPPLESMAMVTVTAPNIVPDIQLKLMPGAQITGVLSAADTHLPLGDVAVVLLRQNTSDSFVTRSITDGQYLLDGLPSGTYKLYFSTRNSDAPASAYVSDYYNHKLTRVTADVITLTAPLSASIDYALPRGAKIVGQVTGPDVTISTTLWASVEAIPAGNNAISDLDLYSGIMVLTDDHGAYTLTVRPGSYKIRVGYYGYYISAQYCGSYYGGKPTLDQASVLSATSATTTTANISLQYPANIAGKIVAEDTGQPVPFTYVAAERSSAREFYDPSLRYDLTDAQGNYQITGLCNAGYQVGFFPPAPYAFEYYTNTNDIAQATPIAVTRGYTIAINAALSYAGLITGRVVSEKTGAPLQYVSVNAVAQIAPQRFATLFSAYTDSHGEYRLWLPANIYRLYYEGLYTCPEWNFNARSATDAPPILIRPKEYRPEINAAITDATIHGKLTSTETGQPLSAVNVSAWGLDTDSRAVGGQHTTNALGEYVLNDVCRGRFALRYQPSAFFTPTNEYPPSFSGQSSTAEQATTINIVGSDSVEFNDTLQKGLPLSVEVLRPPASHIPYVSEVLVLDELGHYVFYDYEYYTKTKFDLLLPKGRYKVQANGIDYDAYYGQHYYNSKGTFAEADIVDLMATTPISTISVTLQAGQSITGQVIDADTGLGLNNALVFVYDANLPRFYETYAYTGAGGYFTTSAVLSPGTYKLLFTRQGYRQMYTGVAQDFGAAAVITVAQGLTGTVSMKLPRAESTFFLTSKVYMPIVPAAPVPIVQFVPPSTPVPTSRPAPTATPVR